MNPRRSMEVPESPSEGPVEESGVHRRIRTEKQERYALDAPGHAFIDRYHPEYLAQGGEHFVYEIPSRPGVVVKAEKRMMHRILRQDPESVEKDSVAQSGVLQRAHEILEHDRRVFQSLQNIFGGEHVLWQKKFLTKVPVSEAILETVARGQAPKYDLPQAKEAWTLVTVQERAQIPEEHLSPQVGASFEMQRLRQAHRHHRDLAEYSRITDDLSIRERAETSDITRDDLLDFFQGTPLEELFAEAMEDPGLRDAMKDFADKAARFAEETGEIIDIGGHDNIVFYKQGGKWTYKLIDPVYLLQRFIARTAKRVVANTLEKKERIANTVDSNAVGQMALFTRTINAIKKFTDGGDFLGFLPESDRKYVYMSVINPDRDYGTKKKAA